jgi:ABC-type polysaccharide/polyol phosphate export permease
MVRWGARRQVSSSPVLSTLTDHLSAPSGKARCVSDMFRLDDSSAKPAAVDEYLGEFHVYEPHKTGLPPMRQYFRELWRRREFAYEMSRAQLRSNNSDTVFGVLWNVLNPMLLAVVYYLLVWVIGGGKRGPEYFAHLLAGLFAFYFVSGCMAGGAASVTSAGKIIMNTAFPRILVVFSAVFIAFRKFLPTMLVYIPVALITKVGIPWTALLAIPMFFLIMVFGTGMALLLATSQVYFRDTSSFLPYVTRIWLYLSPVLYYPDQVPAALRPLEVFNPLFPLLGGWGDLLVRGEPIPWTMWLGAFLWSFGTLIVGALVFMSRERDFAVRL